MKTILANYTVSITELKRKPSALLKESKGQPIAILNHNSPTAYLISAERYEAMLAALEDHELGAIIRERRKEAGDAVDVSLDEL